MVVSQSQVDHIISSASADDPEVKLANLEREVDLIKTSIKRLLMDIRERMNELENPFTITASSGVPLQANTDAAKKASEESSEARESALDAREAALDAKETKMEMDRKKEEEAEIIAPKKEETPETILPVTSPIPSNHLPVPQLPALKSDGTSVAREKLRLHKVYRLFKWTSQSIKKYGHDRLEVMLDSFQSLGYISKESCTEVKEISRLMPENLGEAHEVSPDEYVAELYALNRIISPEDTSLDRDMIEVLMEQKGKQGEEIFSEKLLEENDPGLKRKRASQSAGKSEEIMNLLDRI